MAERTVRLLRDRDSVTDVKAGAREGEGAGDAPALLEMRPKFAHDSPEFKIIAQARSQGPEDEQLAALISSLQNELDLPLDGTAAGPGELVLQVDLRAITLQLVERLQALPQIEAAQPNYIVGAMGIGR